MAKRLTHQLAYRAIRIEGGLIPAEELTRLTLLADPKATEQTEGNYRIAKGLKLRDEIARDFKIALSLWHDFKALRQRQDVQAHDVTVREWLLPLLRDVLHFHDAARCAAIEHAGHQYAIGHAALFSAPTAGPTSGPARGRVPLVFAGFDQTLDGAAERFGETNPDTGKTRRRSPFMLAQEALNATDTSLWAIVSNGLVLRILRDNASLTRPAYIEVDLETLFTEELLADFSAFWLLAHASRFAGPAGQDDAPPSDCPWERWRAAGQQAGVTVRGKLRYQVADALRALGTGFVSHPANGSLRTALQNPDSGYDRQAFFEELLRLVYRLIFLATVEDRRDRGTGERLVFAPKATEAARARYLSGYSLTWLRERAVRRSQHDRHADLWHALTITFGALGRGEPALGLPALGGLFDAEQCAHLDNAQLDNRHLLSAIFQLGWFRADCGLSRVNYRDMGPEELGSVYESLLELVPDLQGLTTPATARLAFVGDDATDASTKGNTRKLTGSYYTPDSLVQELIKSALEPVVAQTVKANPQRPVEALLSLTICDPACGSGHFLLSAARRLADEVALHRAAAEREGGAPTPIDYRHALRDVVSRCIYGVDKNPMAIQLAKTALWLEAYSPDRPLSFIDHHLRIGDALLGVLDPKVLEKGIPDEAYTALSGDDKDVAKALKKKNKEDLESWRAIAGGDLLTQAGLAEQALTVEALDDDSPEHVAAKRLAWETASRQAGGSVLARLADTYLAAFLAPKVAEVTSWVPLSGYLWGVISGQPAQSAVEGPAQALCRQHGVFHWWLAFPQVAARGGFDVMLGNPPWERIKLQEEEFFATRSPLVAEAKHKAERGQRIEWLREGVLLHRVSPDRAQAEGLTPPNRAEVALYEGFIAARRGAEAASLFAHEGRRFPLTGVGDVNTYALFSETFLQAVRESGRAGFIVPTGIATDDSTKAYFERLAVGGHLRSLLCLENEEFVFPSVHHAFRFALLTLGGSPSSAPASLVFFARQPEQIHDAKRRFKLTSEEFALINPNTRTCPVFRSERDAELTKKLYRAAPVLIEEEPRDSEGKALPAVNPWGIRFQTMFHMSGDSGLFRDTPDATNGWPALPLYEAKMVHQFDHRWGSYTQALPDEEPEPDDVTLEQKADPEFTVRPRYWVDQRNVLARIARVPDAVRKHWLVLHLELDPDKRSASAGGLETALSRWLAGELFQREMADADLSTLNTQQLHRLVESVERQLRAGFTTAWRLIREQGWTTRKGLKDLPTWSKVATDARLGSDDLSALELALAGGQAAQMALLDAWMEERSPRWLMGWRDITGVEKIRTVIGGVVPRSAVGHTFPIYFSNEEATKQACLLGNWQSLVFDFIARQKVGGTHLTYGYLKQFPVIPPGQYRAEGLDFIVPRVLELTYTAHDLSPWADDLEAYDHRPFSERARPFAWNPDRRAQLRAELDAYYARLYGLDRDELRYILDPADVMGPDYPSETFRVLKNNEMRQFGEYRTRRLILEAWDRLEANWLGQVSVAATPRFEPAVTMIRNAEEAWLAGLVVALLKESGEGCTVDELQNLVARSEIAANYLDEVAARTLSRNAEVHRLVDARGRLDRVRPIVERLEGAGAVARQLVGASSRFRRTEPTLPDDVTQTAPQVELARLLLLSEARRLATAEKTSLQETPDPKARGAG